MLCEPKYRVGFLGSIIFLGVIIGLLFVPPLADYFGRKVIVIISIILSLLGQFGLLIATSMAEAYAFNFILGLCFAGRNLVGLSYLLEFQLLKYHEIIIFIMLLTESVCVIMITIWY